MCLMFFFGGVSAVDVFDVFFCGVSAVDGFDLFFCGVSAVDVFDGFLGGVSAVGVVSMGLMWKWHIFDAVVNTQMKGTFADDMSADVETQIAALSSLLQVREDVDRGVHIKCVESALKAVILDAASALRVSKLIQEQSNFTQEEKLKLQSAVTEQVGNAAAQRSRRCLQDYTQIDGYLTKSLWDTLRTGVYSNGADALMEHAWQLGLRLPSEPTHAAFTGLLCYFGPEKSMFALSNCFQTTKQAWKAFSKKKAKNEMDVVHLPALPPPADLPEEFKIKAFGREPMVPTVIADSSLKDLVGRIHMRKTSSFLAGTGAAGPAQPQLQQGNGGGDEGMMWQMINVLMSHVARDPGQPNITYFDRRPSGSSVGTMSPLVLPAGSDGPASTVAPRALAAEASAPQPALDKGLAHLQAGVSQKVEAPKESTAALVLSKPEPAAAPVSKQAPAEADEAEPSTDKTATVLKPAVSYAAGMMADLEARDSKKRGQPSGEGHAAMKRPSSSVQKKPSAKLGAQKKPAAKNGANPTHQGLKMDRKNVASRMWHQVRDSVFQKTGDDVLAKRKAREAADKARADWDLKNPIPKSRKK